MRDSGYNKLLRATSGYTFTLFHSFHSSEPHNYAARPASLDFSPEKDGKIIISYSQDTGVDKAFIGRQLTLDTPELTPELEGLLLRLLMQPIDQP